MTVCRMRNYVTVLHARGCGYGFTIQDYETGFDGVFLGGKVDISLGTSCYLL